MFSFPRPGWWVLRDGQNKQALRQKNSSKERLMVSLIAIGGNVFNFSVTSADGIPSTERKTRQRICITMIGGEGGSWTKLDVTGYKRDPARERRIDESKTTLDQRPMKLRIPYFLPHAWQTCRISPMVDQCCPANCSEEARAQRRVSYAETSIDNHKRRRTSAYGRA